MSETSEYINRYVHQVGLYVRPKERADIEAELRSQIQDQLEDRFGASATGEEVAEVLKQMGDPRILAAMYSGEQSLVGPALYPFMMTVLRFGLPLVPTVVIIANLVSAILSPDGENWLALLVGSLFTAGQAAFIFFGIVVIIFAVLQRSGEPVRAAATAEFNPLELPAVDDPAAVDRVESGIGIAIVTLVGIAILYFLQVGGLTLRFNLNDPGDVLPVPVSWLIVLLVTSWSGVLLNLWALLRRRWTVGTWLFQTALDLVGAVGLYYVLFVPVLNRLAETMPEVGDPGSLYPLAALITLIMVVTMVFVSGTRFIRLWQHRQATNIRTA